VITSARDAADIAAAVAEAAGHITPSEAAELGKVIRYDEGQKKAVASFNRTQILDLACFQPVLSDDIMSLR
jgi:hypothetical protein